MEDDQNQQYIDTLRPNNQSPSADTQGNGGKRPKTHLFDRLLYWVQHNFSLALLLLVVIILVEVLWGMQVVRKIQSQLVGRKTAEQVAVSPLPSVAFPTIFAVTVPSTEATVGTTIPVTITLDAAGLHVDGATAVLTYNPALLTFVRIENGPIFKEYTQAKVDQARGRITLTGLADVKTFYTGKGVFANAVFTAKAKGEATIDLDFKPNVTDETTIASEGKEVLGSVRGARVAIK